MLNSGCEYLYELVVKYQDKVACTETNLLNENIRNVDEQKAVKIIDNFVANIGNESQTLREKVSTTPEQNKMVNIEST